MTKIREIGLSIGSSVGDRLRYLQMACEDLQAYEEINIIAKSRVYETDPVGVPDKYKDIKYYNAFIVIETTITPYTLFKITKDMELKHGRSLNHEKNSPRQLDIDIIYAGNLKYDNKYVKVPHKRWHERRFVVQPLADVRPDLIIPGQTETVKQILKRLPKEPSVRYAPGTKYKF
ncbi:MAG: 2-amino-4-hydroxy-6-hydroxymethyldihydropteridine diphosphokinase [Kiritimatiellae bacterium]|jgi:2-amino-4-hydroxy-6-hydroxymethyldihydropteridine diphosphokinase|nr:2-amino-4-hydroxy-6-hydroxymethyldihydropteridine diphosphokinase [Kiritimatiellia bacterium]